MASNHALSYAFWTSRKITYAVLPFILVSWIVCFSVMSWSQVVLPGVPPACDPVISTCFFVKLEELHIVTARKPLIHQNQPVAQYLHKIQPCML